MTTTSLRHKKVVIAGGSGFLGISLAHHMADLGAQVVLLSRNPPIVDGPWRHRRWDGRTLDSWCAELNDAAGLVNLAGRTVNCVKTPAHRDEILRSRVESTQVLGEALRSTDAPPDVWVQMSTAHIYGDPPTAVCTENSALGCGLAPLVGKAWEEAFEKARLPSQRGVVLRTSFVLGRDRGVGAGALDTLCRLARFGLGGRVGSGKQGFSWIHELDINRLFERALTDDTMHGAYIASAPHPVSQVEFMRALRKIVRMPIALPAAAWMVRIAAPLLLRTDPELALYGRYVKSARLAREGYEFAMPHLTEALQDLLRNPQR